MCLVTGAGGNHVPTVRCQGGPVEYRHHRVPVSHRQGPLPGTDATTTQTVLRENTGTQAQV